MIPPELDFIYIKQPLTKIVYHIFDIHMIVLKELDNGNYNTELNSINEAQAKLYEALKEHRN